MKIQIQFGHLIIMMNKIMFLILKLVMSIQNMYLININHQQNHIYNQKIPIEKIFFSKCDFREEPLYLDNLINR